MHGREDRRVCRRGKTIRGSWCLETLFFGNMVLPRNFPMEFPKPDRAVVDVVKLRDYCLNPEHPRGRHKARVFAAALGMERRHAGELEQLILKSLDQAHCEEGERDRYGLRMFASFEIQFHGRAAMLHTAWIIRNTEDFARLTTCYLK